MESFDVKNANGKKVHIFDQHDTRVDTDDLIKYLLQKNAENLILKVKFVDDRPSFNSTGEIITSTVRFYNVKLFFVIC